MDCSHAPDAALNASDIVLMFANDFAEPQEDGYKPPCYSPPVMLSSLVREMLAAAFVSLAQAEAIDLTLGKKKSLFSEHRTVLVTARQALTQITGGLEGAILGHLRGNPADDSVRAVVNRIVGNTTIEPYSALIEISMINACKAGYFDEEQRTGTAAFLGRRTLPRLFKPRCERIATLSARAGEVRRNLDVFRSDQPDLYDVLYEDVEKSVKAAYFRT